MAPGMTLGCPDCETARIVRSSVLDENFWPHLTMMLLPLIVIALMTLVIYRLYSPVPLRIRNRKEVDGHD
jgi:hypothetical protein